MKKINGGLYLVLDPMPGLAVVLPKVKAALEGGIDVIQLWNRWNKQEDPNEFILSICKLAHDYNVPVLINENWEWLQSYPLDGVHFDTIPENIRHIKNAIDHPIIMGITCGNNEDQIRWAIENKMDYISFCSMFPSSTSNSCGLVNPEIIQATREQTSMPIFAAGGITFENASLVLNLGVNGIAIINAIMNSTDPKSATQKFKQCFDRKNQTSIL
jgi:thiamine-phosphate pyrophosphorylase